VFQNLLPNNSSIFAAEARGVLALDLVQKFTGGELLFVSDLLSCLRSLQNRDLFHPPIAEILYRVHGIISDGINVVFIWFASHVGLALNSAADIPAKSALLLPMSKSTVPHSDYSSLIHTYTY